MIPELGHFALILALLLAARAGHAAAGRRAARATPRGWRSRVRSRRRSSCSSRSRSAASRGRSCTTISRCSTSRPNSNSQLPPAYRFAATWGSHEGSMLLWVLMLAGWGVAVSLLQPPPARRDGRARARRHGPRRLRLPAVHAADVESVRPRCFRAPADGRDLNPLLQDPGMVIHPPMLYMGYVGFSVAFAFAIAALLGGRLDATWARWSRPWTTLAWMLPHARHHARQLVGVLRARLGRLVVLGSGRERVVHAVARRHRADPFARGHREARHVQGWTVLLAIAAFSLSLLGTFLVRSGVLTSVHAFATDPRARRLHPAVPRDRDRRLAAAVRVARAARRRSAAASRRSRASRCCSPTTCCWSSRAAPCCSARSIRCSSTRSSLGKISVGPPYFDTVFVPLMAPLVFLMGIGPLARWKKAELPDAVARAASGRSRSPCVLRAGAAASSAAAGRRWSRSACCSRCGSSRRPSCNLRERLRDCARRRLAATLRASRAATGACCSRISASPCSSSA